MRKFRISWILTLILIGITCGASQCFPGAHKKSTRIIDEQEALQIAKEDAYKEFGEIAEYTETIEPINEDEWRIVFEPVDTSKSFGIAYIIRKRGGTFRMKRYDRP